MMKYVICHNIIVLCLISKVLCNNQLFSLPTNAQMENINDHICGKNKETAWCVPSDYSKNIEPWQYRHITNLTLPWYYYLDLQVIDVQDVDDIKQTFTIDLYFKIKWFEPRIVLNDGSSDWTKKVMKIDGDDYITLPIDLLKYFWIPDSEIYGLKKYQYVNVLRPSISFRVSRDRKMRYIARAQVIISCQMTFERYPFDSHRCIFNHGSFTYPSDTIDCIAVTSYDKEKQRTLQYRLEIKDLPHESSVIQSNGRNWTTCGFSIDMKREKTQILCQVYLTSTILVILSWASFIIRPNLDITGRMGLLVTLLLVLVNIFIGAKRGAPKSHGYLNSLDIYLLVCIGVIFGAFFEYVLVLANVKKDKIDETIPFIVVRDEFNRNSIVGQNNIWMKTKEITRECIKSFTKIILKKDQHTYDQISLHLFPICFVSFAIFYFCIHLNN